MAERIRRRREPKEKKLTSELNYVDFPFMLLVLILVAIGIVMVFSASYAQELENAEGETISAGLFYFRRQLIFALIGGTVMFVACKLRYQLFREISVYIYGAAIVLLLVVLIIGSTSHGAKRWISLGPVTIQPSEVAKFAVIVVYAVLLPGFRNIAKQKKLMLYLAGSLGLVLVLIMLEKHLSAIIIIALTAAVMLFVAGLPAKYFLLLIAIGGVGVGAYLAINPYALERVTSFTDPWKDASDTGYQIVQALYAVGSGGMFGLGFGNSRQKYLYLPEPHNDYIFAVICEELGFVGAGIVVLLFILLIVRGYWIALHTKDRFGAFLTTGLITQLALQVFLNICVVLNVIPSTGISLPFISYGGSALILQMFEMGVVMNVSRSCENRLLSQPRLQAQQTDESGGAMG